MPDDTRDLLHLVLQRQPVAALATLHGGVPAASMVPYALMPDGRLVIHVSHLATHTADMQTAPQVALLVTAPEDTSPSPLALPRISVQGLAHRCDDAHADHDLARRLYQARFPDSEPMFGFGDFSLFLIEPTQVRFVAGFGKAHALTGAAWQALMAAP
jgi:putative heme iron utilization protein